MVKGNKKFLGPKSFFAIPNDKTFLYIFLDVL